MAQLHFGQWLKREIENLSLTQAEFSRRSGIPRQTMLVWLAAATPTLRGDNIVRLAKALGKTREEVEEKLQAAAAAEHTPAPDDEHTPAAASDRVPIITPNFDRLIGPDASFIRDGSLVVPFNFTAFALAVEDDAMLPDFRPGDVVVCRDVTFFTIEPGDAHGLVLATADGREEVLFRKLDPIEGDPTHVLAVALNPMTRPRTRKIRMAHVRRVGREVAHFHTGPDAPADVAIDGDQVRKLGQSPRPPKRRDK